MAERLTELPETLKRYNYKQYLDGGIWKLKLGVDCPLSVNTARTAIYTANKNMNGSAISILAGKGEDEGYLFVVPVKNEFQNLVDEV